MTRFFEFEGWVGMHRGTWDQQAETPEAAFSALIARLRAQGYSVPADTRLVCREFSRKHILRGVVRHFGQIGEDMVLALSEGETRAGLTTG